MSRVGLTYGSGARGADGAFFEEKCRDGHRRGGHGEAEKAGGDLHGGFENVTTPQGGFRL